jgi:hypothetical protein
LKPGQLLEEPLMESGEVDVREEVLEGHRSRFRRLSDRWLVTLVMVLAGVSIVAIAAAVHYRTDASTARRASAAAAAPSAQSAQSGPFRPTGPFNRSLTVANSKFPVGEGQHGLLAVVHATTGDERPGVVVAQFSGLSPGLRYRLIGNDCESHGHDFVWASGKASKTGSLLLATFPRSLNPDDVYWMSFDRPGGRFPTGVFGTLGSGQVAPFHSGQDPCAS